MLQIDIFFFFRNGPHVVFERVFGTEKTLRFFFRIEFLSIFFILGDRSDGNKFSFHQITRHIAAKRRKKNTIFYMKFVISLRFFFRCLFMGSIGFNFFEALPFQSHRIQIFLICMRRRPFFPHQRIGAAEKEKNYL